MLTRLRPRFAPHLSLLSLVAIAACSVMPLAIDTKASAPVLDGFGDTTLAPSQANAPARRLFAQGIAQVYAFNEAEAIRSFKAALAQDPNCALCAWGVALQLGPVINNPARGDLTEARQYVDYAVRHSQGASPRDVALIESLALRYGHGSARAIAPPPGAICRAGGSGEDAPDPLDVAYAGYLRELTARFPADPDILVLYAEAEMVATTSDWWDGATGKPAGRIGELASMLEAGLARHPNHVGLNHYMIHAVDSVRVASRAVAAADRLGALAPKSPHLVHMPAHTFALVGRYADATRVNQQAIAADDAMDRELQRQQFTVSKDWRGHNTHFQWYGALMEGRGDLALATARTAAGRSAKGDSMFAEYNRSLPLLTLLHLQRWDALLKEPVAAGGKGVATVLGEMARGIAMARNGRVDDAKAALARLAPAASKLAAQNPGQDWMGKMARSLGGSAEAQLGAEIAFAEQRTDAALALQAKAVEAGAFADANEPPMLASGPRQRLGAMQLRAKRFAAAEQTYRDDLATRPASGWALNGLEQALSAQGKKGEAQRAERDLAVSWARADSQLRAR